MTADTPTPSTATASSPPAIAAVAAATGAALQADTPRALAALRGISASEFAGTHAAFRAAMLERFASGAGDDIPTGLANPFARSILATYRAYWRAALANPARRANEEAKLFGDLEALTQHRGMTDFDALEPVLRERLRLDGLYSLQGLTGPLRELMLWTREDAREYRVALPGGEHTTTVHLLDGFSSLGWADYATCGRRGAGGWATPGALYAVVPRYPSLDSEEFRVTFLGHETQHFADLVRFPGVPQWELEYRAKLVELAQANTTRARVLRKFSEDQGDDPASPHAYANKRVLAALRLRLGLPEGADLDGVDAARLQTEAATELRQDTLRREGTR